MFVSILLGMYIVAFSIGLLFVCKICKSWRRLGALDYISKLGVGFTLFYFTNLFVEILGRKGSGTMIFIASWCYGGLAMVVFILFWKAPTPPGGTTRGLFTRFYTSKVVQDFFQQQYVHRKPCNPAGVCLIRPGRGPAVESPKFGAVPSVRKKKDIAERESCAKKGSWYLVNVVLGRGSFP